MTFDVGRFRSDVKPLDFNFEDKDIKSKRLDY